MAEEPSVRIDYSQLGPIDTPNVASSGAPKIPPVAGYDQWRRVSVDTRYRTRGIEAREYIIACRANNTATSQALRPFKRGRGVQPGLWCVVDNIRPPCPSMGLGRLQECHCRLPRTATKTPPEAATARSTVTAPPTPESKLRVRARLTTPRPEHQPGR